MPSRELFEAQPEEVRNSVVLPGVKANVVIEMAYPSGWDDVLDGSGLVIGIRTFGASAKAPRVIDEYGFSVDKVTAKIKNRFFK
jgi:transketolase